MQKKTSQSPLHLIASDKNHTEENNKIKDIIDLLIKYGADIEQYVDGETPLLTATNDRNTIAIESLLRHGADPLMEDDYNHTFFEALKSPGRWSSWVLEVPIIGLSKIMIFNVL